MTADGTALLAAVLAAPADDAPRLVYADWLEENATADHVGPCPECGGKPRHKLVTRNGEEYRYEQIVCKCAWRRFAVPGNGFAERAEFIRVQCALARTAEVSVASTRLMARERELWSAPLVLRDLPDAGVCELPPLTIDPAEHGRLLSSCLVRRGFVSEIRAPLAVLVGGPCGRCDGRGSLIGDPECENCHGAGRVQHLDDDEGVEDCPACDRMDCPACSGSGRTPGVLAALCAAQPLERVVATDREPTHDVVGWCYWTRGAESLNVDTLRRYALPQAIYDKLGPYTGVGMRPAKDCYDALSAAILAHARQLAGRPATT
jgi:uncharacterized protein (TIGR02996 family)